MELHPVQTVDHKGGKVRAEVTMRAYEVYCALFGSQDELVTGSCRGGFGTGELIAFLYAHTFPREERLKRFDEALVGMEHIG